MKTGSEVIASIIAKHFLQTGKDAEVIGNTVVIHDFKITIECTEQPPNKVNSNVCTCTFSDEDNRKFLEGHKCVYCLKTITVRR